MSWKSEVEKWPGYNSLVKPIHLGRAVLAGMKNRWPAKKMRVIAVTGTNGKTSTCWFIWKMLNEAGHKAGLLTTVGWGVDEIMPQYEHMTTESVGILNERMRKIAELGAEFLVIEVTSHAMSQFRTLGVEPEIAVFTNLTEEHLDYHRTMENYAKAKRKLLKKAKTIVVNADDEWAEFMKKAKSNYSSGDIITYGVEQGDERATDVELGSTGVKYIAKYSSGDIKIATKIPGKFNVYNSLAAATVGWKLGLGPKEIKAGVLALNSVEGRMTRVENKRGIDVIVDYAHTPDAIAKVFESLNALDSCSSRHDVASARRRGGRASASSLVSSGASFGEVSNASGDAKTCAVSREDKNKQKVIAVHGGAGRRDHETREPRGEILGKNADIVIITEDDSRDEDPAEIAEMFARGAEKAGKVRGKDLLIELDREKAIELAIRKAKKGDLVLVLGKGHEKTILRKDGPHEFEDIKVVKKILERSK